jgi:hypothetical protein
MHNLPQLKVWTKSVDLSVNIYVVTGIFLKEEQFGITSQIRRAAVSVPFNIAEGGRNSDKEFIHFLSSFMALYLRFRHNLSSHKYLAMLHLKKQILCFFKLTSCKK